MGRGAVKPPTFAAKYSQVRRILLFFFIFQFATGNFFGSELAKVPVLIRHFRLHQAGAAGSTWCDFLRLHYANNRHREADPVHHQLPLHAFSGQGFTVMLLPDHPAAAFDLVSLHRSRALPPGDDTLLPTDFRSRLLRPPRA